jgi:transcriptional regulator with XRE-family HTH domain
MRQSEMADSLGVAQNTVSAWERGASVPDAQTIVRIADLFNMEAADFINDDAILREPEVEYSSDPAELKDIIARIRAMCRRLTDENDQLRQRITDKEEVISSQRQTIEAMRQQQAPVESKKNVHA